MKRLLLAGLLAAACTSTKPPAPEPESGIPTESTPGVVYVTASALNVRGEASTRSGVVAQVKRGEALEIAGEPPTMAALSADGDWMRVRTGSGVVGWVAARYVSPTRAAPAARRRRAGCPPDSEYRFRNTPVPSFSDSGAHGLVVVEASVDARGIVRSTKVISNSTGDEALALLAEREIQRATFEAPVVNCAPRPFIFTYKRSF